MNKVIIVAILVLSLGISSLFAKSPDQLFEPYGNTSIVVPISNGNIKSEVSTLAIPRYQTNIETAALVLGTFLSGLLPASGPERSVDTVV
ncbi:MAG: hypothetical protein P9L98_02885, partial [Candidatus Kaelpia imicola]|nr:hypothetical protein [Candidatus Kaelpia imicola]